MTLTSRAIAAAVRVIPGDVPRAAALLVAGADGVAGRAVVGGENRDAVCVAPRRVQGPRDVPHLGETGPLSQGVQARRKALRIRHINGMEVRKKRPRGFKKRPRGFK